jgi:DNA-binding SARP family transcriptional activator
MGLLRLAVLGPPEVFHNGSRLTFPLRKAQALLLYLAVEGGLHSRSKLAAFLWPDSGPEAGRIALRNALVPLRRLLVDPDVSASQHNHLLLNERDLLGLNPQASVELDLDVMQQAYQQVRLHSTPASEERYAALVTQSQHALALVRGPFLDGFWLGEDSPFDEWREQQQRQWQVRLLLLLDRLSFWQETAGTFEAARETLTRWLTLDPLAEEAARRLMRVCLALDDPGTAIQVYTAIQARLAQELQITPSSETVTLAAQSRLRAADHGSTSALSTQESGGPPSELLAPLLGRAGAFRQLGERFQQARQGQPQMVLVVGEAGIGKTRLAHEFVAWARTQGAEVLCGQTFEIGGRLPYQPLVQVLRKRLETENAPEDLLDDVWLAELALLLPELRVRYADLPPPVEDELTAKVRLFEACARLLAALARRAPLVLFLDDLQWADEASLDLLRYLGHAWKEQGCQVLLLGTVRVEEVEFQSELATQLDALQRDLLLTRLSLKPLTRAETFQLLEALVGEREPGMLHTRKPQCAALADFLFARTSGQPLYLLETLKLLRERELLVPSLGNDGTWHWEPTEDIAEVLAKEGLRRDLFPPSVRALVQARLGQLTPLARHLVMTSAVLGTQATVHRLWQIATVEGLSPSQITQTRLEALEEAIKSGLLREETGKGLPISYPFTHDLLRDVAYTELGEARRQYLHQLAFDLLRHEGARAAELAYHAQLAGEAETAYHFSVQAGVEAVVVFAVADAIGYYEQARALFREAPRLRDVLSIAEIERLYIHLAQAYTFQDNWNKAQEVYEELLAYARGKHEFTLVSMALNRLAILALQQFFDKPQVYELLKEALQAAERSHDQRALAETEWNRAQVIASAWDDPRGALPHGERALALARSQNDSELEARSLSSLGYIHLLAGNFEQAIQCLEEARTLYARLDPQQSTAWEFSLAHILSGAPLTQLLTHRASEAMGWGLLGFAQVHVGQVQESIQNGRKALALAQEMKNIWLQVGSTISLTYGLLDAGAYEEALTLTQNALALARTLPLRASFQGLLFALGWTSAILQLWEEAGQAFREEDTVVKPLNLGLLYVPALSKMCMYSALAGEWEQASLYAVQAIALRTSVASALIMLDFSPQYETEALLRAGNEKQAREEVQRLGQIIGPNHRFRVPYLQALAILATWEGKRVQAISHLREAVELASAIGLPGEQWQIQAALGKLYEAEGAYKQASIAYAEATNLIQGLAERIQNEALRARFLSGPQIHPVLQHAHRLATSIPDAHTEPSGL